jgi:hypothetical protein
MGNITKGLVPVATHSARQILGQLTALTLLLFVTAC